MTTYGDWEEGAYVIFAVVDRIKSQNSFLFLFGLVDNQPP